MCRWSDHAQATTCRIQFDPWWFEIGTRDWSEFEEGGGGILACVKSGGKSFQRPIVFSRLHQSSPGFATNVFKFQFMKIDPTASGRLSESDDQGKRHRGFQWFSCFCEDPLEEHPRIGHCRGHAWNEGWRHWSSVARRIMGRFRVTSFKRVVEPCFYKEPENMILRRLRNSNVIPVVILEPKDFDSKHFAFDLLKRANRHLEALQLFCPMTLYGTWELQYSRALGSCRSWEIITFTHHWLIQNFEIWLCQHDDLETNHHAQAPPFTCNSWCPGRYEDIIAVVNKCDEKMAEKGQWSNQSDWCGFWDTANKKARHGCPTLSSECSYSCLSHILRAVVILARASSTFASPDGPAAAVTVIVQICTSKGKCWESHASTKMIWSWSGGSVIISLCNFYLWKWPSLGSCDWIHSKPCQSCPVILTTEVPPCWCLSWSCPVHWLGILTLSGWKSFTIHQFAAHIP